MIWRVGCGCRREECVFYIWLEIQCIEHRGGMMGGFYNTTIYGGIGVWKMWWQMIVMRSWEYVVCIVQQSTIGLLRVQQSTIGVLRIQQSTIGRLLHIQQSTEYHKTINRGSDVKHGVAIDSNAVWVCEYVVYVARVSMPNRQRTYRDPWLGKVTYGRGMHVVTMLCNGTKE